MTNIGQILDQESQRITFRSALLTQSIGIYRNPNRRFLHFLTYLSMSDNPTSKNKKNLPLYFHCYEKKIAVKLSALRPEHRVPCRYHFHVDNFSGSVPDD